MVFIPTKLKQFLILLAVFGIIYWFQHVDDKKKNKNRDSIYNNIKLPLLVTAIVGLVICWDNNKFLTIFINECDNQEPIQKISNNSFNPNMQLMARPESLISRPDSLMGRPESLISRPESLISRPESLMARPESLISRPESLISRPESLMERPESLIHPSFFGSKLSRGQPDLDVYTSLPEW